MTVVDLVIPQQDDNGPLSSINHLIVKEMVASASSVDRGAEPSQEDYRFRMSVLIDILAHCPFSPPRTPTTDARPETATLIDNVTTIIIHHQGDHLTAIWASRQLHSPIHLTAYVGQSRCQSPPTSNLQTRTNFMPKVRETRQDVVSGLSDVGDKIGSSLEVRSWW